jgi:tRNA G18 (ribose-2'-O)-methylase SpoU
VADSPAPSPRHHLVLCASLVENPLNLGGLCRTAEAFALTELVLPDLAIAATWPFRQAAASAQRWQPLTACAPDRLPAWLHQRRTQGQTVVALTRSLSSQPLWTYPFPQHTVLVLGRELTGIPDTVLACCDGAITIPQFGQVESLNVHTAGAIAAYAYVQRWQVGG